MKTEDSMVSCPLMDAVRALTNSMVLLIMIR